MKKQKFKLVCLNQDECSYVEYIDDFPEEYSCTICGSLAALYEADFIPIHEMPEHVFEIKCIEKLSHLNNILLK